MIAVKAKKGKTKSVVEPKKVEVDEEEEEEVEDLESEESANERTRKPGNVSNKIDMTMKQDESVRRNLKEPARDYADERPEDRGIFSEPSDSEGDLEAAMAKIKQRRLE